MTYLKNVGVVDLLAGDASRDNLAAARALPVSFVLEGGCVTAATLQLTAEEDWGSKTRLAVELMAATPTLVEDLPPSRYRASISGLKAGCYFGGASRLDLTQAGPAPYKMPVVSAATLRGQLIGRAQEEATVVVMWPLEPRDDDARRLYLLPVTNASFGLDDLPPGRYRLHWMADKSWREGPWRPELRNSTELELPAGGTTRLELP